MENALKAYLAGVVAGDGFCGQALGLHVNDHEFVEFFCYAVVAVYGRPVQPRQTKEGYWEAKTGNGSSEFSELVTYNPSGRTECAHWLRGFFDSEGNARLGSARISDNAHCRRISMYNTDTELITRAQACLTTLGISFRTREVKASAGHLGARPVYEIRLSSSLENYQRFALLVGSSIERKRAAIKAIVESYFDLGERYRNGQRKGAATKKARTMRDTLPSVVEGVRELIQNGVKPTQRACRGIPGYNSVQRYIPQADIVRMAQGEA